MKKLIAIALAALVVLSLAACNYNAFDTTYTFKKVIICMPDGTVVKGDVTSWRDYEDSDMVQVVINGKTYFTHSMNVVLISE